MKIILILTDQSISGYVQDPTQSNASFEYKLTKNWTIVLEDYLSQFPYSYCDLLIDRSDEEFILEPLPQLAKRHLKEYIKSQQFQHFDARAYCHANVVSLSENVQSLMMFGLKHSQEIDRVVGICEHNNAALSGIYSSSMIYNQSYQPGAEKEYSLVCFTSNGDYWRFTLFYSSSLLMSRHLILSHHSSFEHELQATIEYCIEHQLITSSKELSIYSSGKNIFPQDDDELQKH